MEAIGRNPEASGKILPAMLLGMAFAEAIAIYALILAFTNSWLDFLKWEVFDIFDLDILKF